MIFFLSGTFYKQNFLSSKKDQEKKMGKWENSRFFWISGALWYANAMEIFTFYTFLTIDSTAFNLRLFGFQVIV